MKINFFCSAYLDFLSYITRKEIAAFQSTFSLFFDFFHRVWNNNSSTDIIASLLPLLIITFQDINPKSLVSTEVSGKHPVVWLSIKHFSIFFLIKRSPLLPKILMANSDFPYLFLKSLTENRRFIVCVLPSESAFFALFLGSNAMKYCSWNMGLTVRERWILFSR